MRWWSRRCADGRRRACRVALAWVLVVTGWASVGAANAAAQLYWVNWTSRPSIGRANVDGSEANNLFVPVPNGTPPRSGPPYVFSVAVDGRHVYWSNSQFGIGRANLDGSDVQPTFIANSGTSGVAVDGEHIYWTGPGGIGRANLDGSGVEASFVNTASNGGQMAVDGAHLYWINATGVGRANLDGSGVDPGFIVSNRVAVASVAVDASHVYWSNSHGQIGRANLDGSAANLDFITGLTNPTGIAVDDGHIYWGEFSLHSISRANLDGSGVEPKFIKLSDTVTVQGLAVSRPTAPTVPTGWQTLSFAHSGQVLSVSGAGDAPGAAILQWPMGAGEYHSQWQLRPQANRGFDIVNRLSGQCLDIWSERPGALLQWPCDGGLGQRWEFDTSAPDGSYSVLKNAYSGLVINQAGATSARGGAVIQWPQIDGAANERLMIAPAPPGDPTSAPAPTPAAASTTVPAGWVSLGFVHSGQVLSVGGASTQWGAGIVQWPFGLSDTHSQWKLVPREDRGFEIVNRATGQCLDIFSEDLGASLLQWPCYGGLGQRWEFDQDASGSFYSVIENVLSGFAINQAGPTFTPGGAVIQWPETDGDNERLVIAPVPSPDT